MTTNQDSPTPQLPWGPEVRTWVSLLLFAHLFAVVVAVTSYTRPSPLQLRVHELFEPYLRNLHLTALPTSYPFARFHLTHATNIDTDFTVEVDVRAEEGSTETIALPSVPTQPLVRFRRYQALANAAGMLGSGDEGDPAANILPKAIAGSLLKAQGADGGTVRIRALGMPNLDEASSLADIERAAREDVRTVYEAQVIVGPTSVELLRTSTTLEAAPVETPAPRPTTPQTPAEGAPR